MSTSLEPICSHLLSQQQTDKRHHQNNHRDRRPHTVKFIGGRPTSAQAGFASSKARAGVMKARTFGTARQYDNFAQCVLSQIMALRLFIAPHQRRAVPAICHSIVYDFTGSAPSVKLADELFVGMKMQEWKISKVENAEIENTRVEISGVTNCVAYIIQ